MARWWPVLGGVLVAGAVFSLASCSSGDSGDSPEPLAALVGEDGKFDCRRIYTHVPLQAYLSAHLSFSATRFAMSGAGDLASGNGQAQCPVRYYDEGQAGYALFYLRSMSESEEVGWENGTTTYGAWTTGTVALPAGKVSAAVLDSPEHGALMLFTPVDTPTEPPFISLSDAAPDAVRTVIDGLEKDAGSPVPEKTGTAEPGQRELFSEGDRFDCATFFRKEALSGLDDDGLWVPTVTAQNPVVGQPRDDGTRTCMLSTDDGQESTDIIEPDMDMEISALFALVPRDIGSTVVTTGPRDSLRGTSVTDFRDLSQWEEFWNFAGPVDPLSARLTGWQSYNARYCRDNSNCITVTRYVDVDKDEDSARKNPADARADVLPLIRWITQNEISTSGGQS